MEETFYFLKTYLQNYIYIHLHSHKGIYTYTYKKQYIRTSINIDE